MKTHAFQSSPSPRLKGILFGLLLVIAGVLFLSFNFGWINPVWRPIIFSWPMIFIVIGIASFSRHNILVTLLWLILGLFFLVPRIAVSFPESFSGINGDFAYTYWPLLLILLGLCLILKIFIGKSPRSVSYRHDHSDSIEGVNGRIEKKVVFGGSESIFLDPVFRGGVISATFGGVVLDLRRTTLPEGETYLDIDATFGGVELYIPGDWVVETKFQTVLGGVEDKRFILQPPDYTRKLILRGDLTFGGCEIH
ncbi:MAG: cell wall-active antibiotics response protein [Bacteroidales bacterium]|jgi:predicted membrane protein|nr:cell wall-active antibiotics response protein [Bacteroidales bacterium]